MRLKGVWPEKTGHYYIRFHKGQMWHMACIEDYGNGPFAIFYGGDAVESSEIESWWEFEGPYHPPKE